VLLIPHEVLEDTFPLVHVGGVNTKFDPNFGTLMSFTSSSFKNKVEETAAAAATCKALHGCELLPLSAYPARAVLLVGLVSVLRVPANSPTDTRTVVPRGDKLQVTKC